MGAVSPKLIPAEITISASDVQLKAGLSLPRNARGLALFAHGSGSSRLSPRNRYVAEALNRGGVGTVLADLLTAEEEMIDQTTAQFRFDIDLLVRRLIAITDWIGQQVELSHLPIGYFGASTGAAAALAAAAERPNVIRAVVSRGGRPDLSREALTRVSAPSLFIVGGNDAFVLRLNREAMRLLPPTTPGHLEIIPGASHLFQEPGALDRVSQLARHWFQLYLTPGNSGGRPISRPSAGGGE
jgi:dienelactone hydrolase